MPLFSHYIAIDWSAANTPTRGANSIWIAESGDDAVNWPTRAAAMDYLRARIVRAIEREERFLMGFDFAFGLPAGLAKAITGTPRWDALWADLSRRVEDQPNNKNNRFSVGSDLNALIGMEEGPFWGHPHQHGGRYDALSPTAPKSLPPGFPFKRLVERRQRSAKSVFQLAYTGAVGSQSLLGIASLERLRREPAFKDKIAIWPFETRFHLDFSKPITIAEIYPSSHVVDPALHPVTDAAQVLSVARDLSFWDRTGALPDKFSAFGLSDMERDLVLREEGWILGTA